MALKFTLHGVETKSTVTLSKSRGSEKLIRSTKSLLVKQPRADNFIFDRSNLNTCLRSRFNDVLQNQRGQDYPNSCNYPCDWCRRPFDTIPVGIPLTYKRRTDGVSVYTCDGYHCSFECALAFIRCDNSAYGGGRDPLYLDSEYLLANLFHKLYPGQPLRQQQDWRLLRDNGGDTTDEEAAKFTPYVRTANIRLTPMCVPYQQS